MAVTCFIAAIFTIPARGKMVDEIVLQFHNCHMHIILAIMQNGNNLYELSGTKSSIHNFLN
ncbi:hypothetical protein BH18THE2_BH18THE2_10890 [soil metagenome]